jgi:hypothetical protein
MLAWVDVRDGKQLSRLTGAVVIAHMRGLLELMKIHLTAYIPVDALEIHLNRRPSRPGVLGVEA